jgi:hypothetical protein
MWSNRNIIQGDKGGHFRRALATFPNQLMVQKALDKVLPH